MVRCTAIAVVLLISTSAHADEKLAAAIGRPANFDPVIAAAKAEARESGGSYIHIAARARLYRQRELAREAVEFSKTDPDKITPEHRAAYHKELMIQRSVERRRATLARGNAQYAANSAAIGMQYRAAVNRSLGRW